MELLRLGEGSAKQDTALVKPYFYVIAQANPLALEEATKMRKEAVTLEEVLERTGINARAEERQSLKIAQNLIDMRYPLEDIASATQLDIEKVKGLEKGKVKVKR